MYRDVEQALNQTQATVIYRHKSCISILSQLKPRAYETLSITSLNLQVPDGDVSLG